MIALDSNTLVYAYRADAPFHEGARARVRGLAEGAETWAIPWPCVHEFFAVVTNRRIFPEPSPAEHARDQIDAWLESPSVVTLAESSRHWATLSRLIDTGHVSGPRIHDARIAAICLDHGVRELVTMDRDFSRFPDLPTRGLR